MAEKRMFSKTIVTSDDFLELPHSARSFYFMLGIMADDDGFVNAPKAIMRQTGNMVKDLKILIEKHFLIQFASGVIVLRHWHMHNTIKKDRYKPTTCTEEKSKIHLDENKIYMENAPTAEPKRSTNGTKMETQYSVVENSVVECSVSKCQPEHSEPCGKNCGNGVVMLTADEEKKIIDKIGWDAYQMYLRRLTNFITEKGAYVRNHYETILKWYDEDIARGFSVPQKKNIGFDLEEFFNAAVSKSEEDFEHGKT